MRLVAVGAAVAACAAAVAVVTIDSGSSVSERVIPAQIASTIRGAHADLHQIDTHASLVVSGMPEAPPGKIYEVWLSHATGAPQPTDALFSVTSRGNGSVDVPNSLHGVKEIMVTSEPLGGSSHPTSAPLIRISLPA